MIVMQPGAAKRAAARLLVAILCLLAPGAAMAGVEIGFYSREMGANNYPHAFVHVEGALDDGTIVDDTYGFTARSVTPAILFGSVGGEVVAESDAYVAKSTRHFTLALSDLEYRQAMAVVEAWRSKRQPSYNLGRANCIHFVAEIAEALGLEAEVPKSLTRKPRSFLQHVKAENEAEIATRSVLVPAPLAEPAWPLLE